MKKLKTTVKRHIGLSSFIAVRANACDYTELRCKNAVRWCYSSELKRLSAWFIA